MLKTSAELLTLTSEAAALIQRGKISFANAAARGILGEDCVGKSAAALLGADIACAQASSFIGELSVRGTRYIVRVSRMEGADAVFFSSADIPDALLNDAFMYSLRSSLMSLGLSLETLQGLADEKGDESLTRQLSAMGQSYYRVFRIVANATVVRAGREGVLGAAVCEFDMVALLHELAEDIFLLKSSPVLRVNATGAMPVTGDPTLIRQMLMNLLSNCYVHAQSCTRISISLVDCGDRVMLSVDDDGCGIAPEQLHSVFDRFRHGFDMQSMGGGAGLGLTVARTVAELHGGALLLESRPGRGTTVRASINKLTRPNLAFRAPEPPQRMTELFIGLADCLPVESFSGKFFD